MHNNLEVTLVAMVVIALAVIIFSMPIIYFFQLLHLLFLYDSFKRIRISFSRLSESDKEFLRKNFSYYQKLSEEHAVRFERRTSYLIQKKRFFGKENLSITREMKLVVAAHATQLTFGLRPLQLMHFDRIFLHPDKYLSRHTQQFHAGQVSENGFVVLSWRHVIFGMEQPKDGRNVALHEMAHVVFVENDRRFSDNEFGFLNRKALRKWTQLAEQENYSVRNGGKKFLRDYAYSNKDEFFAVAVEAFFEQSHEFYAHSPEMYNAMVTLLKQDPRKSNVLEWNKDRF